MDTALTASHYSFRVSGLGVHPDGILGGAVGDRYPNPWLGRTGLDNASHSWWATPDWFVTVGPEVVAESWEGATRVAIAEPPRSINRVSGFASHLFFEYGDNRAIAVWSPILGMAAFLPRVSDTPTRVTGNFSSDGTDMVWLSAEPGGKWEDLSTMELWAAPLTGDREILERTARRVGPFPYGLDPLPLALGCGYAAAINRSGMDGPNMVVVRLRDGAAHEVGSSSTGDGWNLEQTLGISCNQDGSEPEVIVTLSTGQAEGVIARFPVDP